MEKDLTRRSLVAAVAVSPLSMGAALGQPLHTSDPGIYFDNNGVIVQRNGDGGDTAQREGFAWFGKWVYKSLVGSEWQVQLPINLKSTLDLLESKPGEFRRHPTQIDANPPPPLPTTWKIDPDYSSRDQVTPLIAAMGVWGDNDRLLRLWNARRPCDLILTCVQGTQDIFSPDLTNLYRRAHGDVPDADTDKLAPIGVGALFENISKKGPDEVGDDVNQVVYLIMDKLRSPSSYTDAAAIAYAKGRPVSSGCYIESYRKAYPGDYDADEPTMQARIKAGRTKGWGQECSPVLGALRWYFRAESGGCSSLAELYAPAIDKWLS